MGERRGTKGLELWCRRMTEGYPGVNVVNMTTSWRDGLAFCAIIHHFRPDLIEFSKLNKGDIYYNNDLAFRTAERHLGIPALLEPEDMVEFPVPDRLSILTYLSQFYQTFVVSQGKSTARIAAKRPATSPDLGLVSPASSSPPTKAVGKVRREPCAKCSLPVFIAERLNVGKLLYHRTCFRCARCNSQLTLANYYETENNDFCCETCPDEEKSQDKDKESVLTRSLSDEEKSKSLKETDEYSENFETALEFAGDVGSSKSSDLQYTKARSFFINSQVEDEPPDLPKSKPPIKSLSFGDSGFPTDETRTHVNIESVRLGVSDKRVEKSHDSVTKDTISAEGETNSLVKARMRLFEIKSDVTNENKKVPLRKSNTPSPKDVGRAMAEIETKPEILNTPLKTEVEILKTSSLDNEETEILKAPVKTEVEILKTSSLDSPEENVIDISGQTENSVITVSDVTTNSEEENMDVASPIIISSESSSEIKEEKIPVTESRDLEKDESTLENTNIPHPVEESEDLEESPEDAPGEVSSKIVETGEYPDDLNPFGDEEGEPVDARRKTGNVSLNPFDDEEDEEEEFSKPSPKPAARKKIKPTADDRELSRIYIDRISINPFDEEDEEIPEPVKRKIIQPPKISLNPFWSDDEENEENKPVPKPRLSKSPGGAPEPKPRESGLSITSSTSFGSSSSVCGSGRKKKPAPRPPMFGGTDSGPSSLTSSPSHSVTHSPRSTPKIRKARKAPPPPTSTPLEGGAPPLNIDIAATEDDFEKEKFAKDEQNRNRQSQNLSLQSPSSSENSSSMSAPNKSTYGKWKRRKGQAPARPIPQRRTIKSLPLVEVRRELDLIEIQQQGLEKQGVRLEQIIREKCEAPDVNPDDSLPPEIEEMILQLFELVNEKNELFRKQAELMYLRRQQKLEEEHADIEYQIRCLMSQPEANKTDSDKAREEELINRLVEIVERRNEIIECLEMDRVREAEEDDSINNQLTLFTSKKEDKSSESDGKNKKEKKKHKKEKKSKLKGHRMDADKDIDESESSTSSVKDKKKKKFNIF